MRAHVLHAGCTGAKRAAAWGRGPVHSVPGWPEARPQGRAGTLEPRRRGSINDSMCRMAVQARSLDQHCRATHEATVDLRCGFAVAANKATLKHHGNVMPGAVTPPTHTSEKLFSDTKAFRGRATARE